MWRVGKWWDDFHDFMVTLFHKRGHDLQGSESDSQTVYFGLKYVYSVTSIDELHNTGLEHWEQAYKYSNIACYFVRDFTRPGNSFCEEIVASMDTSPFNLHLALEKLTTQHQYFETLIAFANSPRLQVILQYELIIAIVPKIKGPALELPSSASDWESIIYRITSPYLERDYNWVMREGTHMHSEFKKLQWDAVVHCECSFVMYLMAMREQAAQRCAGSGSRERAQMLGIVKEDQLRHSSPGLSACTDVHNKAETGSTGTYLGVSKLSCRACDLWLKYFNDLHYPRFYTRGRHGKWYWPWAVPEFESDRLGKSMLQMISEEYIEHVRVLGHLLGSSDSSNAGAPPTETAPSSHDIARLLEFTMA
ncbi:hypothetical protein HOY80DRAFT_998275 [Tuber brumale]|nr:hypothetical protein HOY80DRAFT_998275 [Tuber brumale]